MMLTEAEAATKRCPLSFGPAPVATITAAPSPSFGSPFGHQFNQPMFPVMPTNCIGSACMAWRVGAAKVPAYPGDKYAQADNGQMYFKTGTERPEQPEKGFCGQFGVPR